MVCVAYVSTTLLALRLANSPNRLPVLAMYYYLPLVLCDNIVGTNLSRVEESAHDTECAGHRWGRQNALTFVKASTFEGQAEGKSDE